MYANEQITNFDWRKCHTHGIIFIVVVVVRLLLLLLLIRFRSPLFENLSFPGFSSMREKSLGAPSMGPSSQSLSSRLGSSENALQAHTDSVKTRI